MPPTTFCIITYFSNKAIFQPFLFHFSPETRYIGTAMRLVSGEKWGKKGKKEQDWEIQNKL